MSPPPYTTIPLHPLCTVTTIKLHPLCTVSTDLTFLHQRRCPHHHIPLFHCIPRPLHTTSTAYCVHCILHPLYPLVWPFCTKDNVPNTIYHYSTVSTAYCIHCFHWFDLFCTKDNVPTTFLSLFHCVHCILHPLHPLVSPFYTKDNVPTTIYHYSIRYCIHCVLHPLYTASTPSCELTCLHQRQCPHHHIPLLHCVHCVLCPLHTASTAYCFHCGHRMGWPFCTKGNGPHHPYLLSPLCELTCLHQHLLRPLWVTFLHLQSVPITRQRYL